MDGLKRTLPPLAEQKRIVAKVDELMGWCDELDALKQKRAALQRAALKSSLHQLVSTTRSAGDTKAQSNKTSVSPCLRGKKIKSIFPLIQKPEDVKPLRDAILQLAVQGRLVPQNPEEGTAADLLVQIEIEKRRDAEARRERGERIRKTNPLPPITQEEIPFDIPKGWKWVRLGDMASAITKGTTPTTNGHAFQDSGINFLKVENVKFGKVMLGSITKFISQEAHDEQKRSQLEVGDVLFSIAGTIGETCVICPEYLPANTNNKAIDAHD